MGRGNSRDPFEDNAYYHIYNRGYNKSVVFTDKTCYEHFYKLMIKYLEEYKDELKLVSYSLLPNHFHFIIHNLGGTGTHISDFMKKLQGAYSVWHRVKYPLDLGTGTKMPFFEGRFRAKLIKDEEYLAKCLSYVNYNSVKHGLVEKIEEYPYTSYHQVEKTDKSKIKEYQDLMLEELEF